ncbi:MAG: HAD hydrolase family protein [Candidatus Levybacteria bacterium]|nr:HAD hydrolase family protein [Candidatus Levybacteria bacterium]
MFFDYTKQTMVSVEMTDGYSLIDYKKNQSALINDLSNIINKSDLGKHFKIDPTVIAADIENKHVGKGFAVRRIIDWLEETEIKPQKFITFGDSKSDLPMGEKLHELGFKVEFVFVGEKSHLKKTKYPFPIFFTKSKFEKGTLEFLESAN